MLSVLIAARNEIYLEKTIRDILANAEGEIEVLVALDGYLPEPQIVIGDDRVVFYPEPVSIGQRQSINKLAKLAKGKFILKCDAHVAFSKGFDKILAEDCGYATTMVPTMFNLDIATWKPKLHKRTDYMYFTSPTAEKPFRAMYYTGNEYRRLHKNPQLVDDILCIMGPCWFMWKDRFWEQGGCDEGHLCGWGQQGIEVSLKAWLSGGSLKVNKRCWFSHWFRGDVGFPYPLSGKQVEQSRQYSQDLWLNNKWDKQVRPLSWLIDKFKPVPTWDSTIFSTGLLASQKLTSSTNPLNSSMMTSKGEVNSIEGVSPTAVGQSNLEHIIPVRNESEVGGVATSTVVTGMVNLGDALATSSLQGGNKPSIDKTMALDTPTLIEKSTVAVVARVSLPIPAPSCSVNSDMGKESVNSIGVGFNDEHISHGSSIPKDMVNVKHNSSPPTWNKAVEPRPDIILRDGRRFKVKYKVKEAVGV